MNEGKRVEGAKGREMGEETHRERESFNAENGI